ncbi:hypothetical protein [Nitratifractor sp.]
MGQITKGGVTNAMELTAAAIEKRFELEQRMAKAYITSSILPQRFKNIGDVLILNEMSRNLGIPMVMLAQQLYVVHGTPQLSGQGAIALINMSGKFDKPLMFEEREEPWGIRAYTYIDGERVNGPWIDDALIQAEGWNKNAKWKSMKDQMARYRAAAWFARLYAPEALMGMRVEGEAEDVAVSEQAEATAKAEDLNKILSQKTAKPIEEPELAIPATGAQAQEPAVSEAEVVEPEQAQIRESVQAAPAPKRMPLRVSKHYPELIAAGFKQSEVKDFCIKVGLHHGSEEEVNEWFATENLSAWADWYHGVGHHPHSPEYAEAVGSVAPQEAESEPMSDTAPEEQEPQASPAATHQARGGFEVSNAVVARYPMFIKLGLRGPDCLPFAKWAGLDADNIDEFVADPGGVQALIEQFYAEAGDVTPRDR